MSAKRHKTKKQGVFYVERTDGTRSYIATWKEEVPLNVAYPLTTRRRRIEKRASTFDEACRLKADGDAAERKRRPSLGSVERLSERIMAFKWFEYWVRR